MKKFLSSALVAALLPLSALAGVYNFNVTGATADSSRLLSLTHGYATTWGLNSGLYTSLFNDINTGGLIVTSATLTLTNIKDWTGESVDPADALYINILANLDTGLKTKRFDDRSIGSDQPSDTWAEVKNPFLDEPLNSGPTDWNQTLQTSNGFGGILKFNDAVAGSLLKSTDADQSTVNPVVGPVPTGVSWTDKTGGVASTVVINFTAANLAVLTTLLDSDGGSGSPNVGLGFAAECHYYMDGVTLSVTTGSAPPPPSVPDTGSTLVLMGLGLAVLQGFRRSKQ
jgi:hypothetical protein